MCTQKNLFIKQNIYHSYVLASESDTKASTCVGGCMFNGVLYYLNGLLFYAFSAGNNFFVTLM